MSKLNRKTKKSRKTLEQKRSTTSNGYNVLGYFTAILVYAIVGWEMAIIIGLTWLVIYWTDKKDVIRWRDYLPK